MNQRIQLLAEQARKRPMGNSWCYTNPAEFEQKFAELIVEECIRYFNEDYVRDFDTLWREDLSAGLKGHFGVEG